MGSKTLMSRKRVWSWWRGWDSSYITLEGEEIVNGGAARGVKVNAGCRGRSLLPRGCIICPCGPEAFGLSLPRSPGSITGMPLSRPCSRRSMRRGANLPGLCVVAGALTVPAPVLRGVMRSPPWSGASSSCRLSSRAGWFLR